MPMPVPFSFRRPALSSLIICIVLTTINCTFFIVFPDEWERALNSISLKILIFTLIQIFAISSSLAFYCFSYRPNPAIVWYWLLGFAAASACFRFVVLPKLIDVFLLIFPDIKINEQLENIVKEYCERIFKEQNVDAFVTNYFCIFIILILITICYSHFYPKYESNK